MTRPELDRETISQNESATGFLNVDLDIRLRRGLNELLKHLERKMFVLHQEGQWARLELNGKGEPTLDKTLSKIAATIQALPPEAQQLWGKCSLRRLDIGIQTPTQPRPSQFTISQKVAAQLLSIQAEIGLTIYPPDIPAG
jgi:hypothetical protein